MNEMTSYIIYNNKPHYYFNGVLKRFRESVDPNITKDELTSVLNKMRFPIVSKVEKDGDRMKVYGLYDSNMVESWIKGRKSEIIGNLQERREYDVKRMEMILNPVKKQKTVFDPRSTEEIEAEYEKKAQERRKKYEEMMRRKLEAEMKERDEKERENPEENMERVSDELLRNDDVYYEGKKEGGEKINENESINQIDRNAIVSDTLKRIIKFIDDEVESKFFHKEGEKDVASSDYEKGGLDAISWIENFLHYHESFPEKIYEK